MSLFNKAYETYEYHKSLVGVIQTGKSPLLPISHILKNVQIEISISIDGCFVRARALDKKSKDPNVPFEQPTIIPATIESGSRSGTNPAAHPLSDKLDYLIPSESSKHQEYMQLLAKWEASSEYGDVKLSAIKKYLDSGTIVRDLAREQILELDKNNKITAKKINGVEPLQCMVRWRVLGTEEEECWRDGKLFRKWAAYYDAEMKNNEKFITDLCMISGVHEILAPMVPKGIVNKQANAKLISSNDTANFVFRGRFFDAEQASSVGYSTFQKVFVILQWLANNSETSFCVSDRTFLCWNPKGKPVPKFNKSIFGDKKKTIFLSSDYRKELYNTLAGFKNDLPDEEDVIIAAFDAATSGRLSLVYYNELKASDFFDRINSWYSSCCWYFYQNIQSPLLYDIVRFAFGAQRGTDDNSKVDVDDKILKQHMQRLFKCLIERLPIPYDIVKALATKASMPQSYNKNNRERIRSVACAIIRKYLNDKVQKEEWNMSLDKNKLNRDYLYGRLLAVFEKLEIDAMKSRYGYTDNDIRETHADKLWNFYCAKPESGVANINGALRPYLKYLPDIRKNFYLGLIGEIMGKIGETPDIIRNKSLEPCYLMGYYDQRNDLYTSKKDKHEEDK